MKKSNNFMAQAYCLSRLSYRLDWSSKLRLLPQFDNKFPYVKNSCCSTAHRHKYLAAEDVAHLKPTAWCL